MIEQARKFIEQPEVSDKHNISDKMEQLLVKEAKYAIKYMDEFFEIARYMRDTLKRNMIAPNHYWIVIVGSDDSYSYCCSRNKDIKITFKTLTIRVIGFAQTFPIND